MVQHRPDSHHANHPRRLSVKYTIGMSLAMWIEGIGLGLLLSSRINYSAIVGLGLLLLGSLLVLVVTLAWRDRN